MNADFDSILEQCLSQIEGEKARVESCLLAYPGLSDELKPLLRAAEWARAVPEPELTAEARARIEARVLAAPKRRIELRLPSWKLAGVRPAWRWAAAGLAAIVLLALMTGVMAAVTPGVLPGSPAYPIKLAAEQVWLWLSPNSQQPATHLHIAERRFEELEALAGHGDFDPAAAAAMTQQMDAALQTIPDLAASVALRLLQQARSLNEQQARILVSLLSTVPASQREAVQAALLANATQAGRVQALLAALEDGEWPVTTEPPVPPTTMTPSPTQTTKPQPTQTTTPSPTRTITASPTRTMTPSPTQTLTPSPTPTMTPSPTRTITPSPTPTMTPRPTETMAPQPPTKTVTPQPPPPTNTDTPEDRPTKETPPGQTKTPEPPGQTKTPEPPGLTRTP